MAYQTPKKMLKAFTKDRLSAEEKNLIKNQLVAYMESYPLEKVRLAEKEPSNFFSNLIWHKKFMITYIVLSIFIVTGGGAAVAAEQALPGDTLYGLKVTLNEELQGALSLSSEAKAEWSIERIERRLIEVEKLTIKNRLDDEAKNSLQSRIDSQTQDAEQKISNLVNHGQTEKSSNLSTKLEATLKSHAEILLNLSANTSAETQNGTSDIIINLADKVQKVEDNSLSLSDDGGNQAEMQTAVEGKLKAAEKKIEEVSNFIDSKNESALSEAGVEASARLKQSQDLLVKAKVLIEAKSYVEAFEQLKLAMKIAQEAKIILETSQKLDVELNFNLSKPKPQPENNDELTGATVNAQAESQTDAPGSVNIKYLLQKAEELKNQSKDELKQRQENQPRNNSDSAEENENSNGNENRLNLNLNSDNSLSVLIGPR